TKLLSQRIFIFAAGALTRFRERLRRHLAEDFELQDLLFEDLFAVALALDPGRLLDAVEVLVLAEGRLLRDLAALKAHLHGHPDQQPTLLIEGELELLAVGPRDLEDVGRLAADFVFSRRF